MGAGRGFPGKNRAQKAAKQEFIKVLDKDPQNKIALASLASMSYSQAGFGTPEQKSEALGEAKKWNLKRVEVDPNDAEAYYSLGVIAWAEAYPNIQTERVKLNMKPDDSGPIKNDKVKTELKEKYGKAIDDGLSSLQKAIDIDKENDDAMTYLNLLLRKKADLDDTADEAKADVAKAEEWANKSLDIKKVKASRPKEKQQAS